jgi:beta-fructofuranosidase
MPAVPEFILRRLYVPGSLKAEGEAFAFEMNNTLAAVTLQGIDLRIDDGPCATELITVIFPGSGSILASQINAQNTMSLPVNENITVRVMAAAPQKKLTIQADTREAGMLQFSISLSGGGARAETEPGWIAKMAGYIKTCITRLRIQQDEQRPALHFTPPANWMNDPNGLIQWQGKTHLFYQYNPFEAQWGNIHWGHAVSADMLHWRHLPVALAPNLEGADAGGCYSGCAVVQDGVVKLLYTGVFPEVQCLVTSRDDNLVHWQKHPQPVISAPPDGLQWEGFRDPWVWQEGQAWRMALGSGVRGVGGCVLLYVSSDLQVWQYQGIFLQGDAQVREPVDTGTMWECPSFFPLGDKWVLLVSALAAQGALHTLYFVGDYVDGHFIPDGQAQHLDYGAGACFYAPQTFVDEQGRRLMIGWLREARSAAEQLRAGWSGAMSLPRELILNEGKLTCKPAVDLTHLPELTLDLQPCKPGIVKSRCADFLLEIQRDTAVCSAVHLRSTQAPQQELSIGYNPQARQVTVDCRSAGGLLSQAPVCTGDGTIRLHGILDGSVLELYGDIQQPISARFYLKGRKLRVEQVGEVRGKVWGLKP